MYQIRYRRRSFQLLGSIAHNQFTFLLIVNIIFLIAGCFIDANSAMYIFIPVMLPVCKALGYDVVAFGVMATVNLAIGQVTPPVGVNLFVAIGIKIKKGMEVTLQEISKAVMPMLAACIAVLLVVTYIPVTSTALPKLLRKTVLIPETPLPAKPVPPQPLQPVRRIIPSMKSATTATLAGRKPPGTLPALQQKPLPGQMAAVSLAS